MDFLSGFSDDQLALGGCVLALLSCGGLMWVTHFVGPARSNNASDEQATRNILSAKQTGQIEASGERKKAA